MDNAINTTPHPVVVFSTLLRNGFNLFIALRFGLLAIVFLRYSYLLLIWTPLTYDLSAWYAGSTVAYGLVLICLAVYGFVISLGDRPLLKAGFFADA